MPNDFTSHQAGSSCSFIITSRTFTDIIFTTYNYLTIPTVIVLVTHGFKPLARLTWSLGQVESRISHIKYFFILFTSEYPRDPTMPRRQRSPPEAAVSASLFFLLPLELRMMIYELLLIQPESMSIPKDCFSRAAALPKGNVYMPFTCRGCGKTMQTQESKIWRHHHAYGHYWNCDIPQGLPVLPQVSTSFLRTCRFAHLEAFSTLYSRNAFYFSSAQTASKFRRITDTSRSGSLIQEIKIKLRAAYVADQDPWMTYMTRRACSFRDDFLI